MDDINSLATYHWWEGSIYSILCIIAYPLAWSWLQMCRRKKLQKLREFVRSEYDHACLRSCRSRALYEGLKVLQSKFYEFVPYPKLGSWHTKFLSQFIHYCPTELNLRYVYTI